MAQVAMPEQLEFGGDFPSASAWEVRDFQGFRQSREGGGRWKFHISSFDGSTSGESGFCWVTRMEGSPERVPIDKADRILIAGRRYGRQEWDH